MGPRRFLIGPALAVAALITTTACDPPPPRPVFAVTTFADGLDAAPGDGVCEVTPGGDCTLRAAVAEANAAGRGDVVVAAGSMQLQVADPDDGDVDLDVRGDVTLRPAGPLVVDTGAGGALLDVHPDGQLRASALDVYANAVRVAGTAVIDRSRLNNWGAPALQVREGGTAVLSNVTIGALTTNAIVNDGDLATSYTSVVGVWTSSLLHTGATGRTTVAATRFIGVGSLRQNLLPNPDAVLCTGTMPASLGSNHATNGTCALVDPTDIEDGDTTGSWRDRIPVGTLGCGGPYDHDWDGTPRPLDGDGDGVAACDIGGEEGGTGTS